MALAGSDHFVANFNVVQALSRSIDRVFEDAQLSGVLSLNGRNLKEFPSAAGRYDLTDTVVADLAKNRLTEFPVQLCEYGSLETLILYHNCIRSIPIAVQFLASLTYLDLSRNQLVTIPSALTVLPLEVLILTNNRIQTIPNEICRLAGTLMELEISCNRLTTMPLEIGELCKLRVLNARENLLSELPLTLNKLRLRTLDLSSNKLSFLDTGIRHMTSLIEFHVENNPLVFPPSKLCDRGCVHVFKTLELESMRRTKRRPQTPSADEAADVLERRRYRMTAAAAAAASSSTKLIPTTPNDYKYNSMTMSTMEQRRKYRHHTIASEARFYNDEALGNRWTNVPNERPIDSSALDRSIIGVPPLLQKRSPPVGEEAAPSPPGKIETSTPKTTTPNYAKAYACLPSSSSSSSSSTSSSSRSSGATTTMNATPTAPDGASFVDEVMAACERSMTKNGIGSGRRIVGGAATEDINGGDSTRGDEIGCILRRQQQEQNRRRNLSNERSLSSEKTSSIDLEYTAARPIAISTTMYTCEVTPVDRTSSTSFVNSSASTPPRPIPLRATYSIKEEHESSPSHSTTSSSTYSSTMTITASSTTKTPPKSARSDVIQSIYTGGGGSNSSSPSGKKAAAIFTNGQANACCHSHGNPDESKKDTTIKSPSTSSVRHHQNGNGMTNGCAGGAATISHIDEDEPAADSRTIKSGSTIANGVEEKPKVTATNGITIKHSPSASITSDHGSTTSSKGSATNGRAEPTGTTASRKSITTTTTTTMTSQQKRMSISATNGTTIPNTTRSGPLTKGPSQNSLSTSTSSNRLNSTSTSTSSSKPAQQQTSMTNGGGASSKKLSPPSSTHHEAKSAGISAAVAAKTMAPTSTMNGGGQKTDGSTTIGPVFQRTSLAANQARASRSRESLANGQASSNSANSRKDLNDRNQHLVEEMRQVLEKTLKLALPSNVADLAETLSDGVHLCTYINAIRPRTIPSIHSPTDGSTKLPVAKCRRNIENFLMGCRRLGIAESQLFNVSDVADRKTLLTAAKAMQALVKTTISSTSNNSSNSNTTANGIKSATSMANNNNNNNHAKITNV